MLTLLLTALPHRLGEGVSHRGYPLPDHACVHPQGHRRVGVPEASGDQVHGHPGQQRGRVDVPQATQPCWRKPLSQPGPCAGSLYLWINCLINEDPVSG